MSEFKRKNPDKTYDSDKFVSPLEQECEKKFTYYGNGTIVGDEYTINLLNLNDYELREARRNEFADYKDKSVQEFRFVISEGIRKQIFFTGFVQNIETQIKSKSVISAIKQAFRKHGTIYKVVKWYVFI